MATDIKWESPGTLTAVGGTTIASLVDTDGALSAAIDNSTSLGTHMDLEIVLGSFNVSAATNPAMWVYMITSADGTNYDDSDESTTESLKPPFDQLAAIMEMREGSGAETKRITKTQIPVPPRKFKLLLVNRSGVTLAASGSTFKYSLYNLNNV